MSHAEDPKPSPGSPAHGASGEETHSSAGLRQAAQAGRDSSSAIHGGEDWECESLFRHMADTAPVMIWMAGVDKGCFWFNKPWLDFTGRTMAEEVGSGWADGIHPNDRDRCLAVYFSTFDARESFKIEYRLRRWDGEYRWISDQGVPRHSQQGEFIGYIGSCVDIHDRLLAENHLRESEENLRALVQATSPVVWRVDEAGMSPETAEFWENLTGQSASEHGAWGWIEALHPADREGIRLAWQQAFAKKRPFQASYRVLDREGNYQHLDVHGVPVLNRDGSFRLWIGTMTNVTDAVRAEQTLRGSEARLRMLVESASEFAILTIGEDRRIKSWSEGAERIFGYPEDEAVGQPMGLLFLPEDRASGVPERELEAAARDGYAPDERWHLRRDGSVFFASGAVSPIRGSDPPEFVKIARDLTERKRMEEALKEADRRKNEFLATLSHELRNPLAPIRSGLDLLKRAGYDRRLIMRTLKVIERQTDQIVHLVDDLLDISRIIQGKIRLRPELIELAPVVRRVVENSRPLMRERNHRLSSSLPQEPVYLNADAVRIEQVLFNVVGNAAKYTPPGGRIVLDVRTEDGEAVIAVKDNGIGIPQGKLDEVFDIFTQADVTAEDSHSGLGIGLSVVRGLVELHGGTATAQSLGQGQGTEIILRLPLAEKPPEEAPPVKGASAAGHGPPKNGKRVLVVDDNRDAVAMLQILLTMEGHEVRVAFDGEEAVREAEAFRPDVCLCDLGLPKLDGFEVARRLSLSLPETLLISVSGWGQDEDRRRSKESGFADHLVKPVKIEDVIAFFDQE